MKKVLLTGAAGQVGTWLRNSLGNEYHFRCLDIREVQGEEDAVQCDIRDLEAVRAAMEGMDAAVHLGGEPGFDQPWEGVYTTGIGGTYNVLEAARRAGVKQVIYASTTAVLGWREMQRGEKVSPGMPIHPSNLYGVGKAVGEILARYYAEAYRMSIVCLRIGSFQVDPRFPKAPGDDILRAWCSPEDLTQLVRRCLEAENLGFQVFYAVSNNKRRVWNIDNARRLVGYRPTGNAEDLITAAKGVKTETLSRDRILLMRAAVQDGPRALESWQEWLETIDVEKRDLDSISFRLLPVVYHNLAGQQVDPPWMTKLKGTYRRAWLENQLSLQKVVPFITSMHERGIPVLLLDDLSSILSLYSGQGVRRPYSLDILVQPQDVSRLLRFLEESKIWPKVRYAQQFLSVETPLEVWPPFDLPLTVAWRAFTMTRTHEQALAAWQAYRPAVLGDCPVFALDLESLFVRSCLRTRGASPEAAFFSWIDVAWMLNKEAGKIDWEVVLRLARADHQVLRLIETVREVAALSDTPAANELLQRAQDLPVSWMDHLEHRVVNRHEPNPGLLPRAIRRLLLYRRAPKVPGWVGFLRYLQFAWGGIRLRSLPRLLVRHVGSALELPGEK
jgi:dTDP-4-dehydrorhamnose reductase